MIQFSQKQQRIINVFLQHERFSSSGLRAEMSKNGAELLSLVTIKRMLSVLVRQGALKISGAGRATTYSISALGRIFAAVDAKEYCAVEPDKRYGQRGYNFDLLAAFPAELFNATELAQMDNATTEYRQRIKDLPPAIQKNELERLIIELSWKSSKIEGNTYTLLDTENLIRKNQAAAGKTREETQMILNHKAAFDFIRTHKDDFRDITRAGLEELHAILIKNLKVNTGFRKKPVGVLGSVYCPLDNVYQITEAVEMLLVKISTVASPYAKAFLALLGLAYIQPFEDGNKRTARLLTNAILLAHDLAPLSYRSVVENDYREAVLVFYELNSIVSFKKIFIEQYLFAAKNYAV
ncbi:Fic family protein [Candidatus Falkowbacteria bacterium]|nr:Fic family protein [Candidatus Falkowbacteria bacterium]